MSIAVAVGFIALAGVAAQTGVVMLIYLNQAYDAIEVQRAAEARSITRKDLYDAVMENAVERVRPKMMTVVAIIAGLLPIMWSTGTGLEVMQRIAVPMIGGMISSTVLTLVVAKQIGLREAKVIDGLSAPENRIRKSFGSLPLPHGFRSTFRDWTSREVYEHGAKVMSDQTDSTRE